MSEIVWVNPVKGEAAMLLAATLGHEAPLELRV